jgi:hypothetical protein
MLRQFTYYHRSKHTVLSDTAQQYEHLASRTCDMLLPNKQVRINDTYFIAHASNTDDKTEK